MTLDRVQFNQLKHHVEEKLGWGPSETWTQRDFDALSDRIAEKTGTRLSVSTLKRLWRSERTRLPQRATLDALCQLAGYGDWGAFRTAQAQTAPLSGRTAKVPLWRRLGMVLAVVACGIVALLLMQGRHAGLEPGLETVRFSSRKVVSAGVPNTVIFDYDVSGTRADSAVIQQSWDLRRRAVVPRNGHTHTSIYYYPGFHKATLRVGDSVLYAHPIAINTDGWLALARRGLDDLVPVYLDAPDLGKGGMLTVSPELLSAHLIDLSEPYYVSYYRVQDFGPVSADDFKLSARVANPLDQGGLTGQYVSVIIMAENGRHMVSLSIPGCVGNIRVQLGEKNLRGLDNDLSALGCDLDRWQDVDINVVDRHAQVRLGGGSVFETDYTKEMGRVVGLHFLFYGCGRVDDVRLAGADGVIVFADDFGG